MPLIPRLLPLFFMFATLAAAQERVSLPAIQNQVMNTSTALHKTQKVLDAVQQSQADHVRRMEDSLRMLGERIAFLEKSHQTMARRMVTAEVVDSMSSFYALRTKKIRRSLNISFIVFGFIVLGGSFVLYAFLWKTFQQRRPEPADEIRELANKVKKALSDGESPHHPEPPHRPEPASLTDSTVISAPTPAPPNHELPVRVAEEVFRMRMRLARMPQDTKGLAALVNAVNRLEDELNLKGYTIVDLTGQPYFDEMTVAVKEFIPQDDLPAGQRKILRMLRPQVKHGNAFITFGEAEVAMSSEDLARG